MRLTICALILTLLPLAPVGAETDADRLDALLREEWEWVLRENPLVASYAGDRRYNGRWPDLSAAARERRYRHYQELLATLQSFDSAGLSGQDRVNLQLFRQQIGWQVAAHELGLAALALNQREGIQTINYLLDYVDYRSAQDYEDWIARMESFPEYMDGTIGLLREGMQRGIMQPRIIMERLPRQVRAHLVENPEDSLFYAPFKSFPERISPEQQRELARRGREAVLDRVIPAYARLAEFLEEEYLPAAPEKVGAQQWPNGGPAYAFLVRKYTTTELTPDQVHEIGLREVARIRAEMEQVMARTGFTGTFQEFLTFLREDPQFYFTDPQELLKTYRAFSKRVDLELVKYFRTLPRTPYGVEPIPEYIAPDTTTAYYMPPAGDGSRAGIYSVNLYKPEARPRYEIPVLTLHEAVPGHHLQIALALEQGELPAFRRHTDAFGGYTVFVEGWALYAESLGEEMGFYEDPYDKFGQLTYEMWRAVRLVLDTGLHARGWTRDQAIDFFLANTAKSRLDIVNEVDRYIAWPGQALAYKMGELRIKELRHRAEEELGEWFDLRDFHDVLLASGEVSLEVLEDNVQGWIDGVKSRW